MRFRSPALPSFTFGTYVGRHGAVCAVTSKPELFRLAWNASKFRFGSGMYGRETAVGYQKSILHGTWQLDEFSSCFFFQAEDGIRYLTVTGVQTCALPI